jgi:VWFA-related protein
VQRFRLDRNASTLKKVFEGMGRRMLSRAGLSLLCVVCFSTHGFAQQQGGFQPEPAPAAGNHLVLDVVVTDKAGKAVKGLEEKDFAVLDNGHPQKILSFQAAVGGIVPANVQPAEPPMKIILLIDEVNTNFTRVAYERGEIKRFLQQNNGNLAHPVSMAFFSDAGADIQEGASRDGNALLAMFDQRETALRSIRRSNGFYGAVERFQLSFNALMSLAAKEAQTPGRKMVVWISPGWPIFAGPNIQLTAKDQASLFASIVSVSTALNEARITLYSVDPEGAGAGIGGQNFYYQEFLKPVTAAKNMQAGNLALQVLAVHSGGLAFTASNDIAGQITRCVADADAYYTLTVDAAPPDQPNAYHAVTVKVETPGATARTRNGYYAHP